MPEKRRDGEWAARRSRPEPEPAPSDDEGTVEFGVPANEEESPALESEFKRHSARLIKGGREVKDSRLFKDSVGGVQRFWFNYTNSLRIHFQRLDRRGQEDLITRMSQILTVGAAVVTTYIWYWMMPLPVRVIVLPVLLFGSWWVGTKIVGPSMIDRFSHLLHPPDDYQD